MANPRVLALIALSVLPATASSAVAATYTGGAVTIADSPMLSSPYPSTVTTAGEGSIVTGLTVKLDNFTHSFPEDVDVLLTGPSGGGVVLMSDAGGSTPMTNRDLRFSDSGDGPVGEPVVVNTPTNVDDGIDVFPPPAPAGPFGTSLSALAGAQPNGQWSLYIVDDETDDAGSIAGWELRIQSHAPTQTGAQLIPLPIGSGYAEGVGSARLEVSRFGNELQAGGFAYSVVLSSFSAATPGEDYTPVSGRLEWLAGEFSTKTIDVPIVDDAVPEGQECFEFAFSDATGDAAPPRGTPIVCIAPNDGFGVSPAPVARLGGAAVQRVLKQRGVAVTARTNTAVTATATGTITVPRQAAAVVRLKKVQRPMRAGQSAKLKLGLSRKARATLKRSFAIKPRLKAVVRLTTRDYLGRSSSALKQITQKR